MAKYLALLRAVLVEARYEAYGPCPRVAQLLDAVENVPDLLARWPDMEEELVVIDLRSYEKRYLDGAPRFTGILARGPHEGWQLRQKGRHPTAG